MMTTIEVADRAGLSRQSILKRARTRGITPAFQSRNGKVVLWASSQVRLLCKRTKRGEGQAARTVGARAKS